ncbi:hypothetical protein Avbf_13887, partial [Armadillidium vulgare]
MFDKLRGCKMILKKQSHYISNRIKTSSNKPIYVWGCKMKLKIQSHYISNRIKVSSNNFECLTNVGVVK